MSLLYALDLTLTFKMTDRNNEIKAFNRPASIGDLYDARTLKIINGISLFNSESYENFIKSTDSTGQNTF
jgi:hypothetical protein